MTSSVPKPAENCPRQNKKKNFGYKKPPIDCLKEETIICKIPPTPTPPPPIDSAYNVYTHTNGGVIGGNEALNVVMSTNGGDLVTYFQYINLRESLGGNPDSKLIFNSIRILLPTTGELITFTAAIYKLNENVNLGIISEYDSSTLVAMSNEGTISVPDNEARFLDISFDETIELNNNSHYFIGLQCNTTLTSIKSNGTTFGVVPMAPYSLQYLYYYVIGDTLPQNLPSTESNILPKVNVFYYTLYNNV